MSISPWSLPSSLLPPAPQDMLNGSEALSEFLNRSKETSCPQATKRALLRLPDTGTLENSFVVISLQMFQ